MIQTVKNMMPLKDTLYHLRKLSKISADCEQIEILWKMQTNGTIQLSFHVDIDPDSVKIPAGAKPVRKRAGFSKADRDFAKAMRIKL